ncbi:MAG: hypothetical protein QE271_04335 [Bacteriovoracaceae bacterium]|nr:hypothetical protein [Bacteriovoracaceae bacterium]
MFLAIVRLLASFLFLCLFFVSQMSAQTHKSTIPHFDLDMSTSEMQKELSKSFYKTQKSEDPASIIKAIKNGERLSAWLKWENERRSISDQLLLTNPSLRRGHPINKPTIYSDKTVETDTEALMREMPSEMRIYFDQPKLDFPSKLPLSDELFLSYARRMNKIYQTATRYRMLNPYRARYTLSRRKDVRGYYYLSQNHWSAERLDLEYLTLTEREQRDLKNALVGICINFVGTQDQGAGCVNELEKSIKEYKMGKYFSLYIGAAKKIWNSFFLIPNAARRSDIIWNSANPNEASVPFLTPKQDNIKNYLELNIEDEWKWDGWGLNLNFGNDARSPRVVFETGVTPHVNGLGGNEIVMDANEPIEEYESKWTIRHEFGHVLGFPDCYHEFYDTDLSAFVNYQLDITDLMCSRAGNMNERLFSEMKRVYYIKM